MKNPLRFLSGLWGIASEMPPTENHHHSEAEWKELLAETVRLSTVEPGPPKRRPWQSAKAFALQRSAYQAREARKAEAALESELAALQPLLDKHKLLVAEVARLTSVADEHDRKIASHLPKGLTPITATRPQRVRALALHMLAQIPGIDMPIEDQADIANDLAADLRRQFAEMQARDPEKAARFFAKHQNAMMSIGIVPAPAARATDPT